MDLPSASSSSRAGRSSSSVTLRRGGSLALTPSLAQISEKDVTIEVQGFPLPPPFKLGGKQGNIITKSTTNSVHRGWRVVAVSGRRLAASDVAAAMVAAQQAPRYTVTFRLGERDAEAVGDAVPEDRPTALAQAQARREASRRCRLEAEEAEAEAERVRREAERVAQQLREAESESSRRRDVEAEAERRRHEAELAKLAAADERRRREAAEAAERLRHEAEAEARRRAEEAEEEARRRRQAAEAEDAERKRKEAEEDAARRSTARQEEEARRLQEEACRAAQAAAAEAERLRAEEAALRRRQEAEEAERRRRDFEEAERRRRQEVEEAERKRREAEEEAERRLREVHEAEGRRREAEEAARRRQAEELERRREAEEAERRRRDAVEAERQRLLEAEQKKREAEAAERAKREAAVERQRKEEAERQQRVLEEEDRRQAAQLEVQRRAVEVALQKATGLPPRDKVADPQKALMAALSRPVVAKPRKPQGPCDKCDGPHDAEECPHFKKSRDKHQDAWDQYGKKSGGGNEESNQKVLRSAKVVPQPGDGSCLFHSLAYGLRGVTAAQLRAEIADFIAENPQVEVAGNPIRDWVLWDSGLDTASYARSMRTGSRWGGAVELAVCAKVRRVDVDVYERAARGGFVRISNFQGASGAGTMPQQVNLVYGGRVHYDALAV